MKKFGGIPLPFGAILMFVVASLSVLPVFRAPAAAATGLVAATGFPATPPAQICDNAAVLSGPAAPPAGATYVPAGDNLTVNFTRPATTYWFAPGRHTLGVGTFGQVIPADNSTYLGAPGAVIDGQGLNMAAFVGLATNVTIRFLTIQGFVSRRNEGVVNHDSSPGWTVQSNTVQNNQGAGVFVGPGAVVSYNCLRANGQYGFSAYRAGGDSNLVIDHNEIVGNNTGNWEVAIPGCGCAGAGKLWEVTDAKVTNNWVHNNMGPGIWADFNNAGLLIDGNYINDNDDEAIIYEISYNARITNNNLVRNTIVKGKAFAARGTPFPVGAIYISESGGDSRVDGGRYSTFDISRNAMTDNWGGITLFENADRFCGSPNSPTYCTLVNPATVNLTTCVPGTINSAPYFSDCRWKTQNVWVHNNQFNFSMSAVGCSTIGCGEQAILSNYGSSPAWSPYLANVVTDAIAYHQNNLFANNTYMGDWRFASHDVATATFNAWQGSPHAQDAGSTMNGAASPPSLPGNTLDADTAGLEGSLGHWAPWFSATPSRSTARAQAAAASLRVDITAPWGWGVQLDNSPGFAATPGPTTIGFWGLQGAGSVDVTMQVRWMSATAAVLQTDKVSLAQLNTAWQQASANVVAPPGTTWVSVELHGASGVAGNYLYLDQMFVGVPLPPPPAPLPSNLLDADTAGLEGTLGHWVPWFSATPSRSTAQAQAGAASLRIDITAPWGWGVQLNNSPGFPALPGPTTIGFSALQGAGGLSPTMQVRWMSATAAVLQTDRVSLSTLTATWQQASANVVAPPGTTWVSVELLGTSGVAGNYLYLDQMFVGVPLPPPPPPTVANLLDADTAGLEASIGHWVPWFSATTSRSTAQAQSGVASLRIDITAPFGWGVQLNNSPGFGALPGPTTIGFSALQGAGSLSPTMQVRWMSATAAVLQTDKVSLGGLTASWQQASANVVAPVGTAWVTVELLGTTGGAGNYFYADQILVAH